VPTKVLFTADWHLSNTLPYSRPIGEGMTDRLKDEFAALSTLGDIAIEHGCEAIFVLGDIFHRRLLDAVTLKTGVELITTLARAVPVYLLAGNHDGNSAGRYLLEAFRMSAFSNCNVYYLNPGNPVELGSGKSTVSFYPVPYLPSAMARQAIIEGRQTIKYGHRCLLIHQDINGCHDGGWVCERELDAAEVCEGWDTVFAGHYHERQKFGRNGCYIGAPFQHDFRDAGSPSRGVSIASFTGKDCKVDFVPLFAPRFFTCLYTSPPSGWNGLGMSRGDFFLPSFKATFQDWSAWRVGIDVWSENLRSTGVNVLPAKHVPIAQFENRLSGLSQSPSVAEAVRGYVESANTEGLDKAKLLSIAFELIREVQDV